ncbi:MAG TPA: FKBP-type peptidyl-prolyl cis-trans isomerase [Fimbriimonas sp.]|nr:FKBP-type peptidyl-prolyl cis-trans isomerase [Fimbriimonas sp.]
MLVTAFLPILVGHSAPKKPKLIIKDVVVGKGAKAKTGDTVTVDYTGKLTNGTVFDATKKGRPFTFTLGGRVIKGWNEGVVGMRVGGTRKLTIPSDLAYGDQGFPPVIPPKATLIFVIKLNKIEK